MPTDPTSEIVLDLLRSAWIVESARAAVYKGWAQHDERFSASRARALEGASILESSLRAEGRAPDQDLVEPHATWMRSLVGIDPGEIPLGDLFLARLGDWVEGHAGPFLPAGGRRIEALGREEKDALTFPEELPAAPPFEPVATLPVEAPGEVLFTFGILGDIHIGSGAGEIMAAAAIEDLNASGADLVIQLGDITDHGERHEFERATKVLDGLELPWHTMMGNHDVYSASEQRLSGAEYFLEYFARPPQGLLIEHKGVRFALLDSVEHGASPFAPFDFITGAFLEGSGGAVVRGALSPAQHDLLAEIAAPGAGPAFILLHHPTQPFISFPPVLFGLRDADAGRVHAVCDSGNVWGVFAGHTHRNARARDYGSVPVHEVAIPRDYPFGYALVDVTEHGYAYRFVQLSNEELLRDAYPKAGRIHRRYGLGDDRERGFAWLSPAG